MTLRHRFTEKVIGKGRIHRHLKARSEKKRKIKQEMEKQFRKGFVHKSNEPKLFDVKPELPTRGRKRRKRFGLY
jgi:hypothetical protein